MAEYYLYLWSTTWPNVILLVCVFVFIIGRLVGKCSAIVRYARDAWGFMSLSVKVVILLAVLGAYTQLFIRTEPDWLSRPGSLQGQVASKTYDSVSRTYNLGVRSGPTEGQFFIDKTAYDALNLNDKVKITYLPYRKDVIRCEQLEISPGS